MDISANIHTLFSTTVQHIDFAGNMIVLKTINGMAQGVCAALDSMEWDGVGTIAGDDSIFIVARSNAKAVTLTSELKKLL